MNDKICLDQKHIKNDLLEEAYSELRTNIQFCASEKEIKTIAITSCLAGEGKTTTAINLAVSIAKANKKVLYVNTDLRKTIVPREQIIRYSTGLSNFLAGMKEFDDIILESDLPNLFYITNGLIPPNPTELLASEKFTEFIKIVKEKYDMIIFDTPPLGSVIDAAIISSLTDGVIIVIESKAVDYKREKGLIEQLDKAKANILGVVLNKMNHKDYKSYYFNYKT